MASRDFIRHFVSITAPTGSTVGDEWFNTSTNRLSKRVVTNGTTVEWVEQGGAIAVQQAGVAFGSGITTLNFANATLAFDGNTRTVRIVSTSAPAGSDTQVQYNSSGALAGSANFTWNNGTNTLSATNISSSGQITVGTGNAVDPSNVGAFAAGQITESATGFSAPGIVIGSGSGQHGAIVYGSNTMYFGTETGSDNTMNTRMTLTSAGLFLNNLTSGRVTFATTSGQLTDSSSLTWNGTTLGITGFLSVNRTTITNGVQGAWSGTSGIAFQAAGTNTATDGVGTISTRVNYSFGNTTMSALNSNTVTNAINLFVDAPSAGTNTTFTTPYALYANGNVRATGILVADTTIQQLAGFYYQSTSTAVSTAGSVQADATAIVSAINNVSTVGASTQGVRLPAISPAGVRVVIRNATATTFNIYPQSGAQINALGTNAAFTLPGNGAIEFVAVTTTQWVTLGATYA